MRQTNSPEAIVLTKTILTRQAHIFTVHMADLIFEWDELKDAARKSTPSHLNRSDLFSDECSVDS
jgi:hypothetical protein